MKDFEKDIREAIEHIAIGFDSEEFEQNMQEFGSKMKEYGEKYEKVLKHLLNTFHTDPLIFIRLRYSREGLDIPGLKKILKMSENKKRSVLKLKLH